METYAQIVGGSALTKHRHSLEKRKGKEGAGWVSASGVKRGEELREAEGNINLEECKKKGRIYEKDFQAPGYSKRMCIVNEPTSSLSTAKAGPLLSGSPLCDSPLKVGCCYLRGVFSSTRKKKCASTCKGHKRCPGTQTATK